MAAAIAEAERIELPPAVLARVRGLLVAQRRSGRKRLTAAMTVQPFASPVVTHWLLPAAYEAILAKAGRAKAHGRLPVAPADLRSATCDPFAAEPADPRPAFGRHPAPAPLRPARVARLSAMVNPGTVVVAGGTAYGSRNLVVVNMAAGLCELEAVEYASSGTSSCIEVPRPWSMDHAPQAQPRALLRVELGGGGVGAGSAKPSGGALAAVGTAMGTPRALPVLERSCRRRESSLSLRGVGAGRDVVALTGRGERGKHGAERASADPNSGTLMSAIRIATS